MIRETCSCGATTTVDYSRERNLIVACRRETKALEEWRANHRHETPEHEHRWIGEVALCDPDVTYTCSECGATKTEPRDSDVEFTVEPSHEHDWDPGPNDFTGPPRCRVCGVTRSLDPRVSAADVLDIANDGSD